MKSGTGCPRTIEPRKALMRAMQGAIAQATRQPLLRCPITYLLVGTRGRLFNEASSGDESLY